MTRTSFNLIFIISFGVIFTVVDYFNKMEFLSKYILIIALIAYSIGQYSAKYPKNKE